MPNEEAKPFHLQGNYAPVSNELSTENLPIEGAIPPELNGTYVRNGPNPASGTSAHWFGGDGMLHALRLEGGHARSYRNRWVQTKSLTDPDARLLSDAGEVDLTVAVANTSIVRHAGRWLALVETSFPTEVTPELETLGSFDFGGRLASGMTAHPRICAKTGEMHFFGYGFLPPYLMYHRVNAAGELVQSEEIDVTGPTMMHDFAITENYVIFMDLPVVFNLEKAMASMGPAPAGKAGGDSGGDGMPYIWSDDYPARLGVLPRNQPGATVRWFDIDPCYIFHPYNAFERAGSIVLDVCRYDEIWRERTDHFSIPKPHRFSIDLGTGHVTETPLFEGMAEFPCIDERLCGLPARYGYAVRSAALPTEDTAPSAIVKHDLERGIETAWEAPTGCVPGEAVFAPSAAQAGEDEGWLLLYMYDGNRNGSDFVILDATNPASGPVARVQLPQRVPFGFHGGWFSD